MKKTEFLLTPVVGEQFVGRKPVLHELVKELENQKSHIGFCLYGKRRVGKTSILMETRQMLEKRKEIVVAYLSLYSLPELSTKAFADELTETILAAYQEKGKIPLGIKIKKLLQAPLDLVMELLKTSKIEAHLLEHIKVLWEYREKSEDAGYLKQAFNLGETLAKATSTKCIIFLDEFPEILKIENGLQLVKMLRTEYEVQTKTSLVISGSIRKTLDAVALSEASPFYKQLVPKHILPFTLEETAEFLKLYSGHADKVDAEKLHALTAGLPFYLQFIGRQAGYSAGVDNAVKSFIAQEGDLFFKEEFEKLNEKEKSIVLALSKGTASLTETAKELNEPPTTVGRYLPILIEKEIVVKESRGNYKLADSLFSYWLREKTSN